MKIDILVKNVDLIHQTAQKNYLHLRLLTTLDLGCILPYDSIHLSLGRSALILVDEEEALSCTLSSTTPASCLLHSELIRLSTTLINIMTAGPSSSTHTFVCCSNKLHRENTRQVNARG